MSKKSYSKDSYLPSLKGLSINFLTSTMQIESLVSQSMSSKSGLNDFQFLFFDGQGCTFDNGFSFPKIGINCSLSTQYYYFPPCYINDVSTLNYKSLNTQCLTLYSTLKALMMLSGGIWVLTSRRISFPSFCRRAVGSPVFLSKNCQFFGTRIFS